MMRMGEIRFDDGSSILIPQPDPNSWIQLDSTPPLQDSYINTIPDIPAHTAVIECAISNAPQRTDPLWAVLCVLAGSFFLVGAGAFFITLGLTL